MKVFLFIAAMLIGLMATCQTSDSTNYKTGYHDGYKGYTAGLGTCAGTGCAGAALTPLGGLLVYYLVALSPPQENNLGVNKDLFAKNNNYNTGAKDGAAERKNYYAIVGYLGGVALSTALLVYAFKPAK